MKYLKLFDTEAQYESFKNSTDFALPNVSHTIDTHKVFYNSLVEPVSSYVMVDLGLPSGLKWADRNVGASSPEDFGLYFTWGETVGYTADQVGKDKVFEPNNYWDNKDGSTSNFNKYEKDKLTVLEASDDAATINMGSDWRMPTVDELTELINNTNKILIDKNGNEVSSTTSDNFKGMKLVSKTNGNSIFIPASGTCFFSSVDNVGHVGCFWSSSLGINSTYSNNARCLHFYYNGDLSVANNSRFYGYVVRGVHV